MLTWFQTGQTTLKGRKIMKMNIETIPAYDLAYIRRTGPYGAENIQTMDTLKTWAATHHLLDQNSIILGIAQDNPLVTNPEDCRYDTCLVLQSPQPHLFAGEINHGSTFEGQYAVFEVAHTAEAVQLAWTELFPTLAINNLQIDTTKPILERYATKLIEQHLCEICVPIL